MIPSLAAITEIATLQTNPYDSDQSTSDTIREMVKIAKASSGSVLVTRAVNEATSRLSNSARDIEIVRSVFYWIKDNITFKTDEEILVDELGREVPTLGMELLKTPEILLTTKTGDCDDFSTLLVSMLINLGFRNKFVTIAADRDVPWKWSHVYVATYLNDQGRWISLDPSHGLYPGWEHGRSYRKQYWDI